jgi:hypothetical protein
MARDSVKGIIAEFLPAGRYFTFSACNFLPVGICAARLADGGASDPLCAARRRGNLYKDLTTELTEVTEKGFSLRALCTLW